MRAPLAPPRLSVPRWLDAAAHAVDTSCETDRPDSRIACFSAATSLSSTSSWSTAGTGSCHSCASATHGPRKRSTGPMSRCSSLYQALANASRNASRSSAKRREIFSYAGSNRSARSVVSMVGRCFLAASWASGTVSSASLATHWCAPAGDASSSHSWANRFLKKPLPQRVGVSVQVTSSPLVIVSPALPDPWELCHPRPWASSGAASGSGPTLSPDPAPWVLPKVWPPAMSATVSSSFIAIRRKVSRMSRAASSGSGLPLGPSGLT